MVILCFLQKKGEGKVLQGGRRKSVCVLKVLSGFEIPVYLGDMCFENVAFKDDGDVKTESEILIV